jgi:predicted phage terminase large subunit-like protein
MTSAGDARRAREKAVLRELLTIPYCPEVPTPKQADFLLDRSPEALYGGAAGGGKSSALLMGALQGVEVPGFAAIIFRRTLADLKLPGALIDRSHHWIGSPARWSADDHTWTFPSGATISFGYLDNEFGHLRYQGAEFQYIAFDELTQFRELDYRYLFSRLRRPHGASRLLGEVPLRMRAATNPGGPGHDWVRRRFIELWLAHQLDPTITLDRTYHPALLADNPYLDIDAYGQMLDQLDPVTRAQLRDGNWDIRPDGRLFQRAWFGTEPRRDVPDDVAMVRFWDLAATPKTPGRDPDYTVGALVARDRDGTYHLIDIVRFRDTPATVERTVRKTAERDGQAVPVHIEQEPGAAGKALMHHYRTSVLDGYTLRAESPSGSKLIRAQPVAAHAEAGYLTIVTGHWNDAFLDEAELFPDGAHDDQIDAVSGAIAALASRHTPIYDLPGFAEVNASLAHKSSWYTDGPSAPWRTQ